MKYKTKSSLRLFSLQDFWIGVRYESPMPRCHTVEVAFLPFFVLRVVRRPRY